MVTLFDLRDGAAEKPCQLESRAGEVLFFPVLGNGLRQQRGALWLGKESLGTALKIAFFLLIFLAKLNIAQQNNIF